jgi:hypothetical protein
MKRKGNRDASRRGGSKTQIRTCQKFPIPKVFQVSKLSKGSHIVPFS